MIFTQVIPGQPLSSVQKIGLNLVSVLHSGRDVVLAIDLTESVGLNDEGRIRLRQIVEDSLKPGDSVYVVPFDKNVALEEVIPGVNSFGTPIKFNVKSQENVVDIAPTVQEICTPAPGGEETCLVTYYLIKQLWLSSLISLLIFAGLVFGLIKFLRLQKKWELKVDFIATENPEDQKCRLPNNKRIAIGEYDASCTDSIDCPGSEVRAYLERKGEKLYLVPTNLAPIYYNNKEITSRTFISSSTLRVNCPYNRRDYSNSHFEKNQRKFCDLNRELVSKYHFLTDNYHLMLKIDRF